MRKVQLTIKQEEVAPATTSDLVVMNNGKTLKEELSTNVLDKFSREVTVVSSMEKVADGVYDGPYESLVFNGRSLVNLWKKHDTHNQRNFTLYEDGFMETVPNVLYFDHIQKANTGMIKPNTKYLLIVEVVKNTLPVPISFQSDNRTYFYGNSGTMFGAGETGVAKKIITSISDLSTTRDDLRWGAYIQFAQANVSESERGVVKIRQMLIEYIEGMENWDIPFFEGICDVKMPILRNVGKNLFDIEKTLSISGKHTVALGDGSLQFQQSGTRTYLTISGGTFKENTPYTVRYDKVSGQCSLYFVYTDNTEGEKALNNSTSDPNKTLKYLRNNYSDGSTSIIKNIQIEEGSVATTYEDHKTNILRTSEEVVLREVGGVYDTYNPLTGEYVKRIGEIVLSGLSSEQWNFSSLSSDGTKAGFYILSSNITPQPKVGSVTVNNKLPLLPEGAWGSKSHEGCDIGSNALAIVVNTSKLSTPDVGGVRTYLQSNPITVQYELAEPITTIVKPSTIPFAYENGHIILESGSEEQSLLPELKYSAPASKSGVLSTTSKTILKHEQHLHKFEDLLLRESILMDYRLMLTMLDSM